MNLELYLTKEGADAFRELADEIPKAIDNITSSTDKVKIIFQLSYGTIGVHNNEFRNMLNHVVRFQKEASEPLQILQNSLKDTANRIDDYINNRAKQIEVSANKCVDDSLNKRLIKGGSGVGIIKPNQLHHYASNKNQTFTPQFEEITKKYGLDLDDDWNKESLPHQGRHPNNYHEIILENMKQFDNIAQGDKKIFLKLYENLKENVASNPDILYKEFWNKE